MPMSETTPGCPGCGERGRAVAATTIESLVRDDDKRTFSGASAQFCRTPGCEVVYFDERGGVVSKSGVRVPVFQKETDAQRMVCYCFKHAVSDVLAAARPDGSNAVVDEITKACRQGLDRCDENNPQGRCCLGNVRGLMRTEGDVPSCGGCR